MLIDILTNEDLAFLFSSHVDLSSICNVCSLSKSSYFVTRRVFIDKVNAHLDKEAYFIAVLTQKSKEIRKLVDAVFSAYMYTNPNRINFHVMEIELRKEEESCARLELLYRSHKTLLNRLQYIDIIMRKNAMKEIMEDLEC